MKFKTLIAGLVVAAIVSTTVSITAIAVAESQPDYSRIKKDLTVMATIVKGAFRNGSPCKDCRVQISANYLAKQGAVFTISHSRTHLSFSFSGNDGYYDISDAWETVEFIPELVSDILVDVGATLEEAGTRVEILRRGDWDLSHIKIDRSTRSSIRQLNREVRDLEYEMREHEIEMLHVEEESVRKELEASIRELEAEIAQLAAKRQNYNQELETVKSEREKQRAERREQVASRDEQRFEQIQGVTLQAFCDYGSTLKNLPNEERVSLIFKRRKQHRDVILILTKEQVTDCRTNGEELRSRALVYQY